MELVYPFFITFCLIFFSELGDKTQLLVLSFSAHDKPRNILSGVALGTFFSHGIAILFGSNLSFFSSLKFQLYLKSFTYITFIILGFISLVFNKNESSSTNERTLLKKISHYKFNTILIVAISIILGEFGDKTLLASLGTGIQYPNYKISLILGSICGMVFSNSLAIFFGKFIQKFLNPNLMRALSSILFIIFGLIGLIWY